VGVWDGLEDITKSKINQPFSQFSTATFYNGRKYTTGLAQIFRKMDYHSSMRGL
jgi:hypothetical protein